MFEPPQIKRPQYAKIEINEHMIKRHLQMGAGGLNCQKRPTIQRPNFIT